MRGDAGLLPRFPRLSPADLLNLAVDTEDTPANVGAIVILDGDQGLDANRAASRLGARLAGVPPLRRRLYQPGPLGGRPLWVEDPQFDVGRHIDQVEVAPPGDEPALLVLAADLMVPLLDRSRPLWHAWVVTGLPAGRLAVVLKLHHVMADGHAALQLLGELVDGSSARPGAAFAAVPTWRALVGDNLRGRLEAVRGASAFRAAAGVCNGVRMVRVSRGAPRTSLNGSVGPHRQLAVLRLDLSAVRQVAHTHGGKVNDVVLTLVAGGVRALLAARGEPVHGVQLHAGIAASLRSGDDRVDAGNKTGAYLVKLPLGAPEPGVRLPQVVAASRQAKRQPLTAGNLMLRTVARLGLLTRFSRSQHLTNIVESNLVGPRHQVMLFGAPVVDLIGMSNLSGNLALAFLALSYTGHLNVTVQADADLFPDLPVLVEGMHRNWADLLAASR